MNKKHVYCFVIFGIGVFRIIREDKTDLANMKKYIQNEFLKKNNKKILLKNIIQIPEEEFQKIKLRETINE